LKFKLFGKTFEIKDSTSNLPGLSQNEEWAAYLAGRGYSVSSSTALKVSAVIRCVDVVAKTMASLPLNLYKTGSNGKEKAVNHPVYKLLYRLPNRHTTAYEFWHMYIFNLMLTTGAYAKVVRDRNGFITALWNIPTSCVSGIRINKLNGERYIDVTLDGETERLREGEFMFTPGLRFGDSDDPEDPVKIARDVLGLTMALNGYAKGFFENGTNLGGFIEYDGTISDESYERFKESWAKTYAGVTNSNKWAFLESGFKITQLGQKPNDSQALESRKFQITEVCRMFGVPPHKVFDLDRATFSNIEQQNIEYVQESITPMSVRIEQTIYKDLLSEPEQNKYYAKFNVNALLRGDISARTLYYHNARQDGWLSANDIRELEDMNRIPAEEGGDVYAVNGNLIPLSAVPQNLPKGAQKGGVS
jgi:HK97 family phage portal protein